MIEQIQDDPTPVKFDRVVQMGEAQIGILEARPDRPVDAFVLFPGLFILQCSRIESLGFTSTFQSYMFHVKYRPKGEAYLDFRDDETKARTVMSVTSMAFDMYNRLNGAGSLWSVTGIPAKDKG